MLSRDNRPKPGDSKEAITAWLAGSTKDERHAWMEHLTYVHIAESIKGLRLRDGLTQKQLSNGLRTSTSMICLWESGTYHGYTVTTLCKIAAFFDVALIMRFVGWPEFIAFTADGVMRVPAKFSADDLRKQTD